MAEFIDLEPIRAALAAFDNRMSIKGYLQRIAPQLWIEENAPVWLAQCISEVERLRALGCDIPTRVFAERDAALAEIERLRAENARLKAAAS